MTTEIDIEKIASSYSHVTFNAKDEPLFKFRLWELKAFADEYLALSSSEAVGYIQYVDVELWKEVAHELLIRTRKGKSFDIPLYLANPINQQLQTERDECVAEIRRLREALQASHNFISDNYKQPYIKTPDYEDSVCWNSTREALTYKSPSVLKLWEK